MNVRKMLISELEWCEAFYEGLAAEAERAQRPDLAFRARIQACAFSVELCLRGILRSV